MRRIVICEDKLSEAVAISESYVGVCREMGLKTYGATYRNVRNRIIRLGLDISHFNPFKRPGPCPARSIPLEDVLVEGKHYSSSRLRKRLIQAGIKENVCSACGIGPEWNGSSLTLQLDHINGVNDDNRVENLRILCPNCHTQTSTYGSKGTKGSKR